MAGNHVPVRRAPGTPHRVAISAHRGGAGHRPGGTWAAYLAAVNSGAEYVEFDVRRTRDGVLVVYHDPHAERAGITPNALSHAELVAAVGREVPTLAEVLALVAGKARGHVDIKEPGYEAEVLAAATAALGRDGYLVTGDDPVVRAAKQADPDVRALLSLGRGPHEIPLVRTVQVRTSERWPLRRVRACGADGVAMHHRLARAGALGHVARAGIPAMVWTVNNPALIRRMVHDPRIEILITDHPDIALAARG
jgi:glycerophosphoryl diester phosphodiesterase